MIYFDASALAKKYIKEAGSDWINKFIDNTTSLATSKITYPEILSAFIRRNRARDISNDRLVTLVNEFETDWDCFIIVDLHDELLAIVKRLIKKHFLKAADAVHLSSALWLKQAIKEDIIFVASDETLIDAAQSEILKVINPLKD